MSEQKSSPKREAIDVSMVDIPNARNGEPDEISTKHPQTDDSACPRRSPTMLLNDDSVGERMKIDMNDGRVELNGESDQMHIDQSSQDEGSAPVPDFDPNANVPINIFWNQGGERIYVTGSFTGWRKMIGLVKQPDNTFSITIGLPMGTHRFRFVVDNELRFSDFMPTATDQMGNFVNYFEITPEHVRSHLEQEEEQKKLQQLNLQEKEQELKQRRPSATGRARSDSAWRLTNDDDDMGDGYFRYREEDSTTPTKKTQYITDIPPIFTDPKVMEQYYAAIDKQSKSQNGQQQTWLYPPQLPPHLETFILNNYNTMDKDNDIGALSIPNHVVLKHLATTSIKHDILAVASVERYNRKYVTQVLYAPLQQ